MGVPVLFMRACEMDCNFVSSDSSCPSNPGHCWFFFPWQKHGGILDGGYGFMVLRPSQVRRCSLSQCLAKPRLTSQLPGTVTPFYPCWRRNRYFWLGSENWTADTTVCCHVGIDRACKPHCIQNSCMPNAAWMSVAFVGNQWKSVDTWW